MHKNAFSLLLNLILLTSLTSSAQAEMLLLTFQGSGATITGSADLLPFPIPSQNSVFTLSAIVNTEAQGTQPASSSGFYDGGQVSLFEGSNMTLVFENQSINANDGPGVNFFIFNDLTYTDKSISDLTSDIFSLSAVTSTIQTEAAYSIGVYFSSEFDPLSTSGPIDSTSFFIPTIGDWDQAEIMFAAISTTDWSRANVNVPITLVSAAPIPAPATNWLFGSALAGLMGLVRKNRGVRR